MEKHIQHLREVLTVFNREQFYASTQKCVFMASKLLFLGFVVYVEGLEVDESKIEVIRKWSTPSTTTEASSFHGLASFYRRFISHFSSVTTPITNCMKRKHFAWTLEAERAFQDIKRRPTTPPILALSNFTNPSNYMLTYQKSASVQF
jgi:hypothetical protein